MALDHMNIEFIYLFIIEYEQLEEEKKVRKGYHTSSVLTQLNNYKIIFQFTATYFFYYYNLHFQKR